MPINKYTYLLINQISVYITYILTYLFGTIVLKVWPSSSVLLIRNILSIIWHAVIDPMRNNR